MALYECFSILTVFCFSLLKTSCGLDFRNLYPKWFLDLLLSGATGILLTWKKLAFLFIRVFYMDSRNFRYRLIVMTMNSRGTGFLSALIPFQIQTNSKLPCYLSLPPSYFSCSHLLFKLLDLGGSQVWWMWNKDTFSFSHGPKTLFSHLSKPLRLWDQYHLSPSLL